MRWRTDEAGGAEQDGEVNPPALRFLPLMLVLAVLIAVAGWPAGARAQAAHASTPSRAVAERAAVDLKQGMTRDDVRQLLGKPWRTALTGTTGGNGSAPGTLRWTYVWSGSPSSSSSERTLNVDFTAKTEEQWSVSGWNWSAY